jgi:hypothetical protein
VVFHTCFESGVLLGKVRDFRDGTGVLNRDDFKEWLADCREELEESADRWLPHELVPEDRNSLIGDMIRDVVQAVDDAIGFVGSDTDGEGDASPIPADTGAFR